ncbi:DNA adenine methylase [Mucilaginibacter lappiensis]|uniref:site-specific DNA-methyltransferase (adenine-specific) n=1 Tax=Mucilaginibacter lappiensis TaxID=354630 RepID=A0ABR6PJD3_9SPHI|nr:DNA adenine methylase [Mucilaginibacter lappiensis]MBB6109723.1 DNA adenine methylase [Mucilaginibacter lappiensis]SIR13151.1 DNA adenine methylase [Mucilaginibacter lappiensis]
MSKINLKTPISYYGGKQSLAKKICSLIPEHTLYCEPFIGGGAIFFAKEPSLIEVLNDTNRELMNFYKTVQNEFVGLEKEIRITLHSRDLFRKASVIYNYPDMFSDIKRAWAVWILSSQSFSAKLDSSFGYDKSHQTTTKKIINNRDRFTEEYAIRLQNVQLESADALYVIRSRDTKNSFFYLDPPYFNSDCGHYDGYSEQDFENLLIQASKIEGKFLLSSYPSDILTRYSKANNWYMWSVEKGVTVNQKSGYLKRKVEVLTSNYPID